MGRRSLIPARLMTPEQARSAVIKHFSHLTSTGGVNMAQYEAQKNETEMVQVLVGFALDTSGEIAPSLRAKCAMDVLAIARGPLREWVHDGRTVEPAAPRTDGREGTQGEAIESAQASADVAAELDRLVAQRVDPALWPGHVKAVVGDAISFFSETTDDD